MEVRVRNIQSSNMTIITSLTSPSQSTAGEAMSEAVCEWSSSIHRAPNLPAPGNSLLEQLTADVVRKARIATAVHLANSSAVQYQENPS